MPRGRLLSKKISFDERVAQLSLEAALLYTWCIPHLDVEGRIYANPEILKGTVIPYIKELNIEKIVKCIEEMASIKLVTVYGNLPHKYMQFNGFSKNQKVDKLKEAPSSIPTPGQVQINSKAGHPQYNVIQYNINKNNLNQAQNDCLKDGNLSSSNEKETIKTDSLKDDKDNEVPF